MGREPLTLLPELGGHTAYIVRMSDPEEVPDPLDPEQRDESVVLVEKAMEGLSERPMTVVWRAVREAVATEDPRKSDEFWSTMTEVHLWSAVAHWLSPFGVEYRHPTYDESTVLIYRGWWHFRYQDDSLERIERVPFTPSMSQQVTNARFAALALRTGQPLLRRRP